MANLVVIAHGTFLILFLSAIVISLQGNLSEYPILQIYFWVWICAKIIFYLIFRGCVLTMLEQHLMKLSGNGSYTEGFIKHYLGKISISVNDTVVAWLVVAPVAVAVISEIYQYL